MNVYVHEDVDQCLEEMAEDNGLSKTRQIEESVYLAHFFHEATKQGEKVLLFDPDRDPPYREVVLGVRPNQARRSS